MATEHHQPHYSRMSLAALVFGLVSLPASFLPFGLPIALVAVVLGYAARREATGNPRPVKIVNAAIVMGAVALAIWIVVITGFVTFAWLYEG